MSNTDPGQLNWLQELVDSLTSGPGGILVGATVGFLLTVAFEDNVKSWWASSVRRRRGHRSDPGIGKEAFRIGPLQTDCIIVEGDGENTIKEDSIYIAVNSRPVDIPPEVDEWVSEVADEQHRRHLAGKSAAWNGLNYAVERINVSRTTIAEEPEVSLRLQYCDFFTLLAAQQLDRPMRDGLTLRQKYINGRSVDQIPAFLNCGLGVNIVVVTQDNHVIFSKRSAQVALFPGQWSVSANEAVSRSIDSEGRSSPNLYSVARRGVKEELGIQQTEYHLQMLAIHLALDKHLWGVDFVARLRDVRMKDLEERWTRGRADSWEHDRYSFVEFQPRPVLRFILEKGLGGEMTTMAPAIYYLALVNEFGRERMEREIRSAIRDWTS